MRRTILLFMLGISSTALIISAIAVYIFHDVDRDKVAHRNDEFLALGVESFLFAVILGGGVAVITLLARYLCRLKGYAPSAKLALALGIGVALLQYPWDYLGRAALPKLADYSLGLYLIIAIAVCSAVIIRDTFRQMKLSQSPAASFEGRELTK